MNTEIEHQAPVDSIATRIKSMRTSLEMNQNDLARRAGISGSLVSLLESGKRKTVSFDAGASIAKVLGVTLAWLRCEPGAPKERPNPDERRILSFRDLRSDPQTDVSESDPTELSEAQEAFNHRENLAAALQAAAPGMRALLTDESRMTVLELFKLMISYPEKTESLGETIHTIATAHQHRNKMFKKE
jgi:transcriptional regulator with XRE-family HTH domain